MSNKKRSGWRIFAIAFAILVVVGIFANKLNPQQNTTPPSKSEPASAATEQRITPEQEAVLTGKAQEAPFSLSLKEFSFEHNLLSILLIGIAIAYLVAVSYQPAKTVATTIFVGLLLWAVFTTDMMALGLNWIEAFPSTEPGVYFEEHLGKGAATWIAWSLVAISTFLLWRIWKGDKPKSGSLADVVKEFFKGVVELVWTVLALGLVFGVIAIVLLLLNYCTDRSLERITGTLDPSAVECNQLSQQFGESQGGPRIGTHSSPVTICADDGQQWVFTIYPRPPVFEFHPSAIAEHGKVLEGVNPMHFMEVNQLALGPLAYNVWVNKEKFEQYGIDHLKFNVKTP